MKDGETGNWEEGPGLYPKNGGNTKGLVEEGAQGVRGTHSSEVRAVSPLGELRSYAGGTAGTRAGTNSGGGVCRADGVGSCTLLAGDELNAGLSVLDRDRLEEYTCERLLQDISR